jgi:hypothetical protein
MPHKDRLVKPFEHPQALGSFRSWLKLLRENGDVDPRFLPRILVVTLFSLMTSPLRVYERLRYDAVLNRTPVHPSPIFIIGHWRTGTTHLQNLICQDKNFNFVSTFQAMTPGFCLVGNGPLEHTLGWITSLLYQTRLIDNIPLLMDTPQEEEYGIANLCPYSFLHMFSFPRQAEKFFNRYVLFKDLPENELIEWEQIYLKLLRKTSLMTNGLRPVLKNPAHSGRLSAVIRLFPEAKFIHLYRNPYHVYLSTRRLYQVVLPRSQVQQIEWDKLEAFLFRFYTQLMHKFLADKALIPPQNLVEIKFEELEENPLEQIGRIYQSLGIAGFDQAQTSIQSYLDSIAGYQKNEYILNRDIIDKVNRHWAFAFEEWGYERL